MLVALVALAVATSYVGRLGVGKEHLTAAVRAVVQLAIVSTVIAATLRSLGVPGLCAGHATAGRR
ncbi:MAG: ABC transporter permease [Nocardioides sp.]